jgi:hypothetical protein
MMSLMKPHLQTLISITEINTLQKYYMVTTHSLLFAVIGVNTILIQIFLVPFIIILLGIYYPGQWYISLFRIIDVAIGGAIAVAMVYLRGLK